MRSEPVWRVRTSSRYDVLALDVTTTDAARAWTIFNETVKMLCQPGETVKIYRNGRLADSVRYTTAGYAALVYDAAFRSETS